MFAGGGLQPAAARLRIGAKRTDAHRLRHRLSKAIISELLDIDVAAIEHTNQQMRMAFARIAVAHMAIDRIAEVVHRRHSC